MRFNFFHLMPYDVVADFLDRGGAFIVNQDLNSAAE